MLSICSACKQIKDKRYGIYLASSLLQRKQRLTVRSHQTAAQKQTTNFTSLLVLFFIVKYFNCAAAQCGVISRKFHKTHNNNNSVLACKTNTYGNNNLNIYIYIYLFVYICAHKMPNMWAK